MNITNKCNNRCLYCISYSTRNNVSLDMNALDSIKSVNKKYKFNKDDLFVVNGGEPTVSDEISSILDFLLETGIAIRVYTNGRKLYEQKFLSYLTNENIHWIIPFYGTTSIHDKYTGVKTSFQDTKKSLMAFPLGDKKNYSIKLLIGSLSQIESFELLLNNTITTNTIHISLLLYEDYKKRMQLAVELRPFINSLARRGYSLKFSNFPLCALTADLKKLLELYDGIRDVTINEYYFILSNNAYKIDYDKNHNWDKKCTDCSFHSLCVDNSKKYRALVFDSNTVYLGEE